MMSTTLPRLLKASEVAEQIGETEWWVYKQARENGMPTIRFGRAMRFDPAAVRAWLNNGGTEKVG